MRQHTVWSVPLLTHCAKQAVALCALRLGQCLLRGCWTVLAVMHACASGYPFSTYGDTAACWLQDIILVLLIAKYR